MMKTKIKGSKFSYKYNIFNFKCFKVNLVVLHAYDYTDWHDHELRQLSIMLYGKYMEQILKHPLLVKGPIIEADNNLHCYSGSSSFLNYEDFHRILGISTKTYILNVGFK